MRVGRPSSFCGVDPSYLESDVRINGQSTPRPSGLTTTTCFGVLGIILSQALIILTTILKTKSSKKRRFQQQRYTHSDISVRQLLCAGHGNKIETLQLLRVTSHDRLFKQTAQRNTWLSFAPPLSNEAPREGAMKLHVEKNLGIDRQNKTEHGTKGEHFSSTTAVLRRNSFTHD